MSQLCSTCGSQNPDDSTFCIRCGSKVESTQAPQQSSPTNPAGNSGAASNVEHPSSTHSGYQAQQVQPTNAATFYSAAGQMGSDAGSIVGQNIPHAFAGRGTVITRQSWLLFGQHSNATSLRSTIQDILLLRKFQPVQFRAEKLREQGYWTEERDYLTMQRGVATVFIYVAPAGQDIYISRATTVQLSFDSMRIVLLGLLIAEIFLVPPILLSTLSSASSFLAIIPSIIAAFICASLYIPSVMILVAFLIASFKHWFTERDFWVYLRRNNLHDFEIDDVMLLEHATDETVQGAVKQLRMDATKIVPPPTGYQTKRRVRVI